MPDSAFSRKTDSHRPVQSIFGDSKRKGSIRRERARKFPSLFLLVVGGLSGFLQGNFQNDLSFGEGMAIDFLLHDFFSLEAGLAYPPFASPAGLPSCLYRK